MTVRALVMAGGAGARMRRSGASEPKPLVRVRGVPMLERNLLALIGAGLRDIVVAVPSALPDVAEFVRGRGCAIGAVAGARVSVFEEQTPLGTIGCAALVGGGVEALLVVNADNLTALDLRAMLGEHAASGAALTIATHRESYRLAFGEVEVVDGAVVAYREKPERSALVCSALSVLAPRALDAFVPGTPFTLPALVEQLLRAGETVHAFAHAAPWIDVNDAAAVERAEALIAAHLAAFECWCPAPDVAVVGAVLRDGEHLLLERRPPGARLYPDVWDTPGGKLEGGETPADGIVREIEEELGLRLASPEQLTIFDDLDPGSQCSVRHHVFGARVARDAIDTRGDRLRWFSAAEAAGLPDASPAVSRSLAGASRPA